MCEPVRRVEHVHQKLEVLLRLHGIGPKLVESNVEWLNTKEDMGVGGCKIRISGSLRGLAVPLNQFIDVDLKLGSIGDRV